MELQISKSEPQNSYKHCQITFKTFMSSLMSLVIWQQ